MIINMKYLLIVLMLMYVGCECPDKSGKINEKSIEGYAQIHKLKDYYKYDNGSYLYVVVDRTNQVWLYDWTRNNGGLDERIDISHIIDKHFKPKDQIPNVSNAPEIPKQRTEDVMFEIIKEMERLKTEVKDLKEDGY